jgi:CBS domain-containing protein
VTPDRLGRDLVREAPLLRRDETVGAAVQQVLDIGLPALPVVDAKDQLVGIFGEREFMGALFPGYLKELKYAGFVPGTLDDAIEKRAGCRHEPVGDYMHTEHIDVGADFSDAQLAETFLHHRVLIIPDVDAGHVQGVVTRADFFRRSANASSSTNESGRPRPSDARPNRAGRPQTLFRSRLIGAAAAGALIGVILWWREMYWLGKKPRQ